MAYSVAWITPVRVVQAIFAVIVLGLTAYAVSEYWDSPDTINFMLFNSVWTLFIAVPYLTLAPIYFPRFAHGFVVLAMEVVTMIFWFAGFIALGALLPPPRACHGSVCSSLQAATVFGAFEWALFAATFAMALMAVLRPGTGSSVKPAPQTTVHMGV